MSSHEHDVDEKKQPKVILDIDGVLRCAVKNLSKIKSKKWQQFYKDNQLFIESGGYTQLLPAPLMPFLYYLHHNNFDIYFSSAGSTLVNEPFLKHINQRAEKLSGIRLLNLEGNHVFSAEQLRSSDGGCKVKDIAEQLGLEPKAMSNVIIIDDTPEGIAKGQKSFALQVREFWELPLDLMTYSWDERGDDASFITDISFKQLNNLYYAVGIIDTALEIYKKETNTKTIEIILFELQFNTHYRSISERDMCNPESQDKFEYYERGLKCLKEINSLYGLNHELALLLPSTYHSAAFGHWPDHLANENPHIDKLSDNKCSFYSSSEIAAESNQLDIEKKTPTVSI